MGSTTTASDNEPNVFPGALTDVDGDGSITCDDCDEVDVHNSDPLLADTDRRSRVDDGVEISRRHQRPSISLDD